MPCGYCGQPTSTAEIVKCSTCGNIDIADLPESIKQRLEELTGGSAATLGEAIEQFEMTAAVLATAQDDITAANDLITKLRLLLYIARNTIASAKQESLFLTPAVTSQIHEFETSYDSLKDFLEPPF